MRLWHKDFIEVLPRQQLLGQWREISAIAENLRKMGTPNHVLVNKITSYPIDHFISYAYYIKEEMKMRGYKPNKKVWDSVESLKEDYSLIPLKDLFDKWHSKLYLKICYYNLLEKFSCSAISTDEYIRVFRKYNEKVLQYMTAPEQM